MSFVDYSNILQKKSIEENSVHISCKKIEEKDFINADKVFTDRINGSVTTIPSNINEVIKKESNIKNNINDDFFSIKDYKLSEQKINDLNKTLLEQHSELNNIKKSYSDLINNYNQLMNDNDKLFDKYNELYKQHEELLIVHNDISLEDNNIFKKIKQITSIYKPFTEQIHNLIDNFNYITITDNDIVKNNDKKELLELSYKNNKVDKTEKNDKCDWCHTEEEVLSVLHLYKPDKFVEYISPIQLNINEITVNNQVLMRTEKNFTEETTDIELPKSKFASQLIGFRAVLKSDLLKDNVPEIKFILKGGTANIQTIKYKANKGLITPRINLPNCLFDDNTVNEASKGRFTRYYSDITSIEIESKYVRDLYGIYRINSSVISDRFRLLDFYGKYKYPTQKLVNIFKHDYGELQFACIHNLLDIVKWIVYSDEQNNIEQKYMNDLESKKREYKNSLYLLCGNVVDKEPQARLFVCLKQALENGSFNVAKFLLFELLEHLDYNTSPYQVFIQDLTNAVSKSRSLECFSLIYEVNQVLKQRYEQTDDVQVGSERRLLDNHKKLHHDNLLN